MKKESEKEIYHKNDFGVASLILAILGISFVFVIPLGGIGGIILCLISLIFGIIQIKKNKNSWAVWGIALSIIGILINLATLIFYIELLKEVTLKMEELRAQGLIE